MARGVRLHACECGVGSADAHSHTRRHAPRTGPRWKLSDRAAVPHDSLANGAARELEVPPFSRSGRPPGGRFTIPVSSHLRRTGCRSTPAARRDTGMALVRRFWAGSPRLLAAVVAFAVCRMPMGRRPLRSATDTPWPPDTPPSPCTCRCRHGRHTPPHGQRAAGPEDARHVDTWRPWYGGDRGHPHAVWRIDRAAVAKKRAGGRLHDALRP